ncbi:cmc1-cytochrome c oxidase biogenesis protein [Phlyctema vagabunda]|uniref:COX assembly mitochondrial protein n=1 Tax=Phlyctema vagabunda TaxID=108571 RepID=A0ABR4P6R2_9HELO
MHPHLHTKDNRACEEVMTILDECHARGFMWKAVGMCNGAKTAVNKCLRAQRLERTAANREAAKIKRQEIKDKWGEIDANS